MGFVNSLFSAWGGNFTELHTWPVVGLGSQKTKGWSMYSHRQQNSWMQTSCFCTVTYLQGLCHCREEEALGSCRCCSKAVHELLRLRDDVQHPMFVSFQIQGRFLTVSSKGAATWGFLNINSQQQVIAFSMPFSVDKRQLQTRLGLSYFRLHLEHAVWLTLQELKSG